MISFHFIGDREIKYPTKNQNSGKWTHLLSEGNDKIYHFIEVPFKRDVKGPRNIAQGSRS